jgi:arylsulfatase A-like enzyme
MDVADDARLAMCREAMALAKREEEKKLVLEALARITSAESLDALTSSLDDPALRNAASVAAVTVAESLVMHQPDAAERAMRRVLAVATDAELVRRANEVIAQATRKPEPNDGANAAGRQPNFLFFLTDDQAQACLGAMGNSTIHTPHVDRLAADGVLFTNAFATTAICCSNRACILTGQHMRRHGIRDFVTPLSAEQLAQTYPMLLKKAGYRVGYLGKFAIGAPKPEIRDLALPEKMFDYWYGFSQGIDFRQVENGEPRYLTTVMTERAIDFLRGCRADQPFCLTVALKEPHGPWSYFDPQFKNAYEATNIPPPATFTQEAYDALPQFIRESLGSREAAQWFANPERYQQRMRNFYWLISRADLAVGQIMKAIRDLGFDENTVVFYSADNGEMQGAHGLNGKWLMYEESIRVPMIVRDPRLPAESRGRRSSEMVLGIDLAPTMLAMAGLPVPERMQGRDLQPLLRAQATGWREDWYYEHTYANPPQHPIPRCEGVRTDRWKYTRYTDFSPPYEQLFDLTADPGELRNLAGEQTNADVLQRLRARCDEYRRSLE